MRWNNFVKYVIQNSSIYSPLKWYSNKACSLAIAWFSQNPYMAVRKPGVTVAQFVQAENYEEIFWLEKDLLCIIATILNFNRELWTQRASRRSAVGVLMALSTTGV